MYRDNPSRTAYARYYLHLGPIEVNRTGTCQYFLWIGIWDTMQTADRSQHRDGFESIVLFADCDPLLLDLTGWTADAIGASESVYLKPVTSAADAYYRVTADQLRLITEATDIRLRTTGASPKEYELWDDQRAARNNLTQFLHLISL